MSKQKRKIDGDNNLGIKDQKVVLDGVVAETTEEFLARGGKIDEVQPRTPEEIMESIKRQNSFYATHYSIAKKDKGQ